VLVNPRHTSQECSACGCIDKENRKSQSKFVCKDCGFTANADINAAINILERGKHEDNIVIKKVKKQHKIKKQKEQI
jgi:transposase